MEDFLETACLREIETVLKEEGLLHMILVY